MMTVKARCTMTRVLLAVLLLTLAGCSSWWDKKEPPVDPNLFPTDYKKEILDTMRNALTVNTNVRDASISAPVLAPVGKEQRYTACVRSNSRDISGAYTGAKDRIAYFYGGHLNQLVEATPEQCANAAYTPFPELEHLCEARECK
jgi:hypothetical protein